jgi:hypothetical protein
MVHYVLYCFLYCPTLPCRKKFLPPLSLSLSPLFPPLVSFLTQPCCLLCPASKLVPSFGFPPFPFLPPPPVFLPSSLVKAPQPGSSRKEKSVYCAFSANILVSALCLSTHTHTPPLKQHKHTFDILLINYSLFLIPHSSTPGPLSFVPPDSLKIPDPITQLL